MTLCVAALRGERGPVAAALRAASVHVVDVPSAGVPLLYFCGDNGGDPAAVARLSAAGHRRILAVGPGDGDAAWDLIASGASDVLSSDDGTAEMILARLQRWEAIDDILTSDLVRKNLVGTSRPWLHMLEQLIEIARFSTRSILITGQTGTGKEMAARLAHTLDRRPGKGPLVILDCTTIVHSLSGSELFGHARGAFTGALSDRRGAFALANDGTLFLDEVGELPLTLQSELLRVIQDGTYKPVGSDRWEHTSFRLICATNRDLVAMQASGGFRSDLYHRIAATIVRLPSLEERVTDIPLLARHFLRAELGDDAPDLSPLVERYLFERLYPGNVRDLKQLVARMSCRHVGPGPITVGDLPEEDRRRPPPECWLGESALLAVINKAVGAGTSLHDLKETIADLAVAAALVASGGNVSVAARRLQVTDRALHLRLAARRENARSGSDVAYAG